MRQHLPLNTLLKVLKSQNVATPFKSKLLVLIYHVHVEASVNTPFSVSSVFIWNGNSVPPPTNLKSGESGASMVGTTEHSLESQPDETSISADDLTTQQSFPLMDLLANNLENVTTALSGPTGLKYERLNFLSNSLSVIRALFKFQMCYSVNDPVSTSLFQQMSTILAYQPSEDDPQSQLYTPQWNQCFESTKFEILKILFHISDVFLEIRLNELFRYSTQLTVETGTNPPLDADDNFTETEFTNINSETVRKICTENSLFQMLPDLQTIFQSLLVSGEHRGLNQIVIQLLYRECLAYSTTFAHLKEIKVLTGTSVQERSKLVNTKLVFIRKIIVDSTLINQQNRLLVTLVDSMLLYLFDDNHLQSIGLSSLNPSAKKLEELIDPFTSQIQPQSKMQDLMRDISATDTIFELLSKCNDPTLVQKSLRFLSYLAFKSPQNQQKCLDFLPVLLRFVTFGSGSGSSDSKTSSTSIEPLFSHNSIESKTVLPSLWVTLRCIFKNNPYAQSINPSSLSIFFSLVKNPNYPLAYRIEILNLLSYLTIVETKSSKQPSKANQFTIINWIIQNFPSFNKDLNLSNPKECVSQPFVKSFVFLLGNCAFRRNSSAQTICRTLLSLSSCLNVLRSRSVTLETKEAYWHFIGSVYTDTPLQSLLSSEMVLFDSYLGLFNTMISSISKNPNPFSFTQYLSVLLDSFDSFAKSFLSPSSWNREDEGGSTNKKSSTENRDFSLWYDTKVKPHIASVMTTLLALGTSFSTIAMVTRKIRSIITVLSNSSLVILTPETATAAESWLSENSEVDAETVLAGLDTEWKWSSFISSLVHSSAGLVFQSVIDYLILLESFSSFHFSPYFDPLSSNNVPFLISVLDSVRSLVDFHPQKTTAVPVPERTTETPADLVVPLTNNLANLAEQILSNHPNSELQTRIDTFGGTKMMLGLLEHPSLIIRYKAFFTLQTLLNEGNPNVQKTVLEAIQSGQSSLIASIESLLFDFLDSAQTSSWWLQDELILKNRFDKRQEVEPLEDEEDDTLEEQVANFYPPLNVMVFPFQIFRVTFSFLIQLAEGHNLRAQNLLSTLLPSILKLFSVYIPPDLPSPFSAFFAQKPAIYASNVVHEWYFDLNIILDTLIEITQGPCLTNQKLILFQGNHSIINLFTSTNSFQYFFNKHSNWLKPFKQRNAPRFDHAALAIQAQQFVHYFIATEFERDMFNKLSILSNSLFEGSFASTSGHILNISKLAEIITPTINASGYIYLWAMKMLESHRKVIIKTDFEGIEHEDAFSNDNSQTSSFLGFSSNDAPEHGNIVWWTEACEELLSQVMGLYILVAHLSHWNSRGSSGTVSLVLQEEAEPSGESSLVSDDTDVTDVPDVPVVEPDNQENEKTEAPTADSVITSIVGAPRQARLSLPIDSRVQTFLEHKLGYIEITRDSELENVYFMRHELSDLVTDVDKQNIMFKVDRSTPSDKINDFQDSEKQLYDHLKLRNETTKNPTWKTITNEKLQRTVRYTINTLVFVINLLLIILSTVPSDSPGALGIRAAIIPLGILVLIGYIFISFTFFAVEGKHLWAGNSLKERLQHFFSEFQGIYLVSLIVFAILGVIWPWWFAFHVLDIFKSSSVLITILQSVSKNAYSILLTFMLVLLVVYYFAILSFLYFDNQFGPENAEGDPIGCKSVLECFGFIIGTLASGEIIEGATVDISQFFFQISFFLIVVIILLNITFAIIIDSFGALRDERNAILEDMSTKAFISSLDSSLFERNGISFEAHSKLEHNPWFYLDYFIYLHEKFLKDGGVTEFTGQESLIWANYKTDSINFYPIGAAGSLSRVISQGRQDAAEESRTQFLMISTNLKAMWKHVEGLEKAQRSKDTLLSKLQLRLDRQIEKSINMNDKNATLIAEYIESMRKQEEERITNERSRFSRRK